MDLIEKKIVSPICHAYGYTKTPAPDASVVCKDIVEKKDKTIAEMDAKILDWVNHSAGLKEQLDDLEAQIKAGGFEPPNPMEKFWNTKYPAVDDLTYTCRYIHLADGTNEACQVDPRIFFQPFGGQVKGIALSILASLRFKLKREPTYDEIAHECQRWVVKHITYKSDKKVQGIDEYWQFWYETLELKSGDCEDGAILMANIMLAAGIPYWRVRLNAGDVKLGGHAYAGYCRETDNEFVILDWCYWVKDTPISERTLHRDERDYYGIWWSWNQRFCFRKVTFVEGGE